MKGWDMESNDIPKIWWHDITGAHAFISAIISVLEDNKSALLKVPYDLPWRKELRNEFQYIISDKSNHDQIFYYEVDALDQCSKRDPGEFLLEKSSLSGKIKYTYRSNSKTKIQKVLLDNAVLKNQIYWIKGFDKQISEKWIDFCNGFSPSLETGLFVLEIPEQYCSDVLPSETLGIINYRDYVSGYDANLMNNLVLQRRKNTPVELCPYVAALTYKLCDFDVEVATDFLINFEWKNQEPLSVLQLLCAEPEYVKRGAQANSNHIFSLVRNDETEKIIQKIWEAQIQSFFPIIEIERKQIIELFYNDIFSCIQNEDISQYGDRITNPSEVEIGTLYFLIKSDETCDYFDDIDEESRKRIRFLRDCRNTLAHGKIIDNDSIKILLYLF